MILKKVKREHIKIEVKHFHLKIYILFYFSIFNVHENLCVTEINVKYFIFQYCIPTDALLENFGKITEKHIGNKTA